MSHLYLCFTSAHLFSVQQNCCAQRNLLILAPGVSERGVTALNPVIDSHVRAGTMPQTRSDVAQQDDAADAQASLTGNISAEVMLQALAQQQQAQQQALQDFMQQQTAALQAH